MIAIRIDTYRNNFATFINDRSIPQLDSRISRNQSIEVNRGPAALRNDRAQTGIVKGTIASVDTHRLQVRIDARGYAASACLQSSNVKNRPSFPKHGVEDTVVSWERLKANYIARFVYRHGRCKIAAESAKVSHFPVLPKKAMLRLISRQK